MVRSKFWRRDSQTCIFSSLISWLLSCFSLHRIGTTMESISGWYIWFGSCEGLATYLAIFLFERLRETCHGVSYDGQCVAVRFHGPLNVLWRYQCFWGVTLDANWDMNAAMTTLEPSCKIFNELLQFSNIYEFETSRRLQSRREAEKKGWTMDYLNLLIFGVTWQARWCILHSCCHRASLRELAWPLFEYITVIIIVFQSFCYLTLAARKYMLIIGRRSPTLPSRPNNTFSNLYFDTFVRIYTTTVQHVIGS